MVPAGDVQNGASQVAQTLALMLTHIVRHMETTVHAVGCGIVLALPVVLGFLSLGVAISLQEGSTLLLALKSLKLLQARQTSMHLGRQTCDLGMSF